MTRRQVSRPKGERGIDHDLRRALVRLTQRWVDEAFRHRLAADELSDADDCERLMHSTESDLLLRCVAELTAAANAVAPSRWPP